MENKDVWVYIEQNGSLTRTTREVLSEGRRLADKAGYKLVAVLTGYKVDGLIKDIAEFGADSVLLIENPALANFSTITCCDVLAELIKRYLPVAVFFGATLTSHDLVPRLASLTKATLLTDCEQVEIEENGELKLSKPAYGGQVWLTLNISPERLALVTISAGVSEINTHSKEPQITHINDIQIAAATAVCHEGILKANPETVDVTEARVVISGGRGLGKNGFVNLKKIANMIGASYGGTRVAVDNNWIPYTRQIGQTGKTISPEVFISLGASGAIHYAAGFKDSEFILAVDKNPRAAIFEIADVGAVADLNELLPILLNMISNGGSISTGDTG